MSGAAFVAFELLCLGVVGVSLAALIRRRGSAEVLPSYVFIALAAWLGEQSCITWYRFYSYAPDWHVKLLDVPVLVPLIWPLVVLFAREVVESLWPSTGWRRALLVAGVVAFDASLVEALAVHAGLWTWAEGGHLGVPLIGIVGWAAFAFGVELALGRSSVRWTWLVLPLAPLAAHVGIQLFWWGALRHLARGPLPWQGWVLLVLGSAVGLSQVARARREGRTLPWDVALPRASAALVFVGLLAFIDVRAPWHWLHVALVALPYIRALPGRVWLEAGRRPV